MKAVDSMGAGGTQSVPLYGLNPTERFSDHADDYAKFRPGYPAAAVDWILDGVNGDGSTARVVDLGAGTGIFSRLLAERGVQVRAVEPNAAMRERGASASTALVEWLSGSAEATGVDEGWADVVVAAQAWHWFRPDETGREVQRILRDGGRLAVVWNSDDTGSEQTRAFREVMQRFATTPRVHEQMIDARAVSGLGWPVNVRERGFAHSQRLTVDGLLGRARSASYAPKEPIARSAMEAELRGVFARFAVIERAVAGSAVKTREQTIEIGYVARVFLAEKAVADDDRR